ncbi:MAG: pre-16S rRNA-processing nuclease YqgF [Armatimonadota bacterium]
MNKSITVLAVDPGRSKCGVAVARTTTEPTHSIEILHKSVVDSAHLGNTVADLQQKHHSDVIIVGDGTTSSQAAKTIGKVSAVPIEIVDEKFTSLLARKRFFQDNPPRGLKRLIPLSLQTPHRPCDDYVAVILAERYLQTAQNV